MKKIGNSIIGIILIVLGVIFAFNALEITNIDVFFDGWWTLFIIVPSIIGFFKDEEKTSNIIGLLIGVALLLSARDVIDFSIIFKLIIPVILVGIGISFVFKDKFNKKVTEEIKKINEKNNKEENESEICATFSGQDINFNNEEFKGSDLTAVFGGVKLDLTNAIITEDVVINCTAIFGGIDIKVPSDIKIKVKSASIFGGVSNEKKNTADEKGKTIYINANCLFGGVEIK